MGPGITSNLRDEVVSNSVVICHVEIWFTCVVPAESPAVSISFPCLLYVYLLEPGHYSSESWARPDEYGRSSREGAIVRDSEVIPTSITQLPASPPTAPNSAEKQQRSARVSTAEKGGQTYPRLARPVGAGLNVEAATNTLDDDSRILSVAPPPPLPEIVCDKHQ